MIAEFLMGFIYTPATPILTDFICEFIFPVGEGISIGNPYNNRDYVYPPPVPFKKYS